MGQKREIVSFVVLYKVFYRKIGGFAKKDSLRLKEPFKDHMSFPESYYVIRHICLLQS